MNKNALKSYAIWARVQLMEAVKLRAYAYGIDENGCGEELARIIGDKPLSDTEIEQRAALVSKIKEKGYLQTIEEVAYTWFNRFIALRYMEVNGVLPSRVRVFSNERGAFDPEILKQALHLDFADNSVVIELIEKQDNEGLFKYLVIAQCNALHKQLPGLFEPIHDYTELLFPNKLLSEGSVAEQLVLAINEEDWKSQVQVLGWLYQFYNSELKDETYEYLKKNKLTKERIPAVTQLFTPKWIVQYMVENSLGRLWYEGHPDDSMKAKWKYYLDEAEQEEAVQGQLDEIRKEYTSIKPEEIKILDPCMGSGHILAYAFDVLMQIYISQGWSERDAVKSIVENNLYGMDIDDRAYQLAYFSVMMKAQLYDKRFLNRGINPHLYAICESDWLKDCYAELTDDAKAKEILRYVADAFDDAKEYGSILNVEQKDYPYLLEALNKAESMGVVSWESNRSPEMLQDAKALVGQAMVLSQQYDVVVTNPPYMAPTPVQKPFVEKNYPDAKSDLFAVFIEKCQSLTKDNKFYAMITMQSWMFLSSFEKLRAKLMLRDTVNMAHLGARAFDEIGGGVVQTTTFVRRTSYIHNHRGVFCRLLEPKSEQEKCDMFLEGMNRYYPKQDYFNRIPGSPIAYWVKDHIIDLFDNKKIGDFGNTKKGVLTGNDERFVRLWFEISIVKFGRNLKNYEDMIAKNYKWIPATGGGEFRKWYGNFENVINMENDSYEIRYKNKNNFRLRDSSFYFSECSTWSEVSGKGLSMRFVPNGILFGNSGPVCFWNSNISYWLAFLNSKVSESLLLFISPTLTFGPEQLKRLPAIIEKNDVVEPISIDSVSISKTDWDSFETSWDFEVHPLIRQIAVHPQLFERGNIDLAECYDCWAQECEERFTQLKANEEDLNRIFIDIYGLQDELTPEVEDKDVTVRKADLQRDIKSLLSYAVGCIFGRYSVNKSGLVFAGGGFEDTYWKYKGNAPLDKNGNPISGGYAGISQAKEHYPRLRDADSYENATVLTIEPDADNIIPICDDEYFDDDLTCKVIDFIKNVFGEHALESNLSFIASALGGNGTPREVIRKYFLNDFYKDHLKIYQKRPIYWQFDSGKKNGFKCLIYMHRYRPDLIAKIRTDYIFEQQERYRTQIDNLESDIANASTTERIKLLKQLQKYKDQLHELNLYQEKVHHIADQMIDIDLDDGVKVNYAKFGDLLAKIK